jgi:hypothetical protein
LIKGAHPEYHNNDICMFLAPYYASCC